MLIEGNTILIGEFLGVAFMVGAVFTATLIRKGIVRRASKQLKESKEQFVALSSHYLLTPISIIQGAVTSLEENDSTMTSEERMKQYDNIHKGQQRLWILAEQFVLANQIESGGMALKIETESVVEVVTSAISALDVFARDKQLHLTMKDETGALDQVRIDQRRMRQAIIALIDNAVKFSPAESTVVVVLRQEDRVFAIDVTDQGAGMSGQAITQATQAFGRGTNSYTFDHEGIGLGLYTANAIIREHGGDLRIATAKTGTTVTLRFPII